MQHDLPRHMKRFDSAAFYWRTAIRPHRAAALAILLLTVGSAALDTMAVGLTIPTLDGLIKPSEAQQSPLVAAMTQVLRAMGVVPSVNTVTFALMVVVTTFFAIKSALVLLSQYGTAAVAIKLRRTMKALLFDRCLHARYAEMSTRARGVVMQDINLPAESLAGVITQLAQLLSGALSSLLMIALLMYLSWWVTLLIGVAAIGGVQGWRWFANRRSAALGRVLYDLRGEQQQLQVDAIDGLKVVKAHALERRMVERQDALSAAEFQPELRLVFFQHGPVLLNEVIAAGIVLGLGGVTFLLPSLGLRFSMLVAFLLAIRRIAPAMASINIASVCLNRYKRNLEVIDGMLNQLPQERRDGAAIDQIEELRIAEVSFAYAARPDHPVLAEITATLRRSTVTALVGSTGAGKSTLANLLLGLYEPSSGAILVNGRPLVEMDLSLWRQHIGYVSQDVFVFNATIRDNMALGDERVPIAQIEWAARISQLHDFIISLPEGYDTIVGDRGVRLSGGQCQRLAIARAVLRRPEVLIFDEATSALDNLTERAVYDAISTLHRDAIVLVIAHRLSTIREADQILVLEAGRIVEHGTHDSLIRQRGLYARLYEEDGPRLHDASEPASVAT